MFLQCTVIIPITTRTKTTIFRIHFNHFKINNNCYLNNVLFIYYFSYFPYCLYYIMFSVKPLYNNAKKRKAIQKYFLNENNHIAWFIL